MSEISDTALVSIFMADQTRQEGSMVHALAAGVDVVGGPPVEIEGLHKIQAAFTVIVFVEAENRFAHHEFSACLKLLTESGQVYVPVPDQPPVRIAAVTRFNLPTGPYGPIPRARCRHTFEMRFDGLPLDPGQVYTWQFEIDGDADPRWQWTFAVPAPQPGPVFG